MIKAKALKKNRGYIFLLLLVTGAAAQSTKPGFLADFKKAGPAEKVRLAANTHFDEIVSYYSRIKDTLAQIKKTEYQNPQPSRLKFLFDKLEANREMYYKNYARAIFIYENSLHNHAATINDSLRCLVGLKDLFIKIKNYNKAIELNHLIERKWPFKTDTVPIYYGTAKSSIYHQIGLTEKAIAERRKEFNALQKKDTNATVGYCNDVGVFYNVLKNSDSASAYFIRARHLLEHMYYPPKRRDAINFYKALIEGNLGLAYYNCGKINEAMPLLKKDIYYSLQVNNYGSALNSYLLFIKIQLDLKNRAMATRYLDTAKIMADKITDPAYRLKFLLARAEYYDRTGNFSKASENYREYLELKNETTTLENVQRMKNERVSISIDQKEMELAERDNILKQMQLNEARERSYKAYLVAGVLVMLVIIGFLILNNYNAKKREEQLSNKNKQISSQKFQIEQSLKEKDVLIKEIHHRVKNNLQIINSMLSLQIAKVEDEKTESILRDAKQRISSIALTHQMLYQKENLSTVDLSEYLERLVRQIQLIMPLSDIELVTEIQAGSNRLSIDNAVPLGLLVNELLTNAYKHAFPVGTKGRIVVALTENEDSFTISVSDNGIGLPQDFRALESKTLGMELIYILADQLDSSLTIENTSGSSFKLNVKKT